jgi:hypothetical protein
MEIQSLIFLPIKVFYLNEHFSHSYILQIGLDVELSAIFVTTVYCADEWDQSDTQERKIKF